ncbi:relaxase/mobilization nuclease domain-containing protein [Legionella feeleii]|uniref:Type IV secretion system T-DNA border endonuclease VirD2 n=1 Tax=Legionella feeleii TaxID=453 RepID=A0A378IWI5_9GAMM|nr:relaxase/mobilization nuclease domain-containing protein [Legionella feeleii]STX39282.1 type IV secretion system T-DNA border endonuclease VirD2 [Legionella feeleii]
MANDRDDEQGFLEEAWQSRRFVSPFMQDELLEERKRKKSQFNKNRKPSPIAAHIKYGNRKNEIAYYEELSTAEQIRIAAGFQQAIVKVTSYGKGFDKVLNHLVYISRDFDLPLENQDKSLLQTRDDSIDLLSSWQSVFFDNRKNARDTVHLVFSAPPGTNRATFKQLTREFLSEEYEGEHDYLFVQHDDTEHPHIHSVICMRSIEGKKLDPRKKYLRELRQRYAKKCRENGILLASSRRFERGLLGKSTKSELVHMREKRQHFPHVDQALIERVKQEIHTKDFFGNAGDERKLTRNQLMRSKFYNTAKTLYDNYMKAEASKRLDKDIKAAKLLLDYAKTFPQEKSRADYLREALQKKSVTPLSRGSKSKETDFEPDLNE